MMTSAKPMAMSRSRVQTRISLRNECAELEFEGKALASETGSGLSGIAEVAGSFSSGLSIFGCQVFIARALRAAPDLIPGGAASMHHRERSVANWIPGAGGVLPGGRAAAGAWRIIPGKSGGPPAAGRQVHRTQKTWVNRLERNLRKPGRLLLRFPCAGLACQGRLRGSRIFAPGRIRLRSSRPRDRWPARRWARMRRSGVGAGEELRGARRAGFLRRQFASARRQL